MPAARIMIVVLLLLLSGAGPLPAQSGEADPPQVHFIATGGTIARAVRSRLSGESLISRLRGIEDVAALTIEEFSNVPSEYLTFEQWRALARRVNALYRSRPELSGIVVTHGTDALEETAYFLSLTVRDCRPVVLTGAMRPSNDVGRDGPANLFNAIRLAASPGAHGLGTMVLMHDYFYAARDVVKLHTSRLDAFDAPGPGPLGATGWPAITYYDDAARRRCQGALFDVDSVGAIAPRVDIVYGHVGDDGTLVRAAVAAGAEGIVLAGMGQGGATPGQQIALQEAVDRGVFVVRSSRVPAGGVPLDAGDLRHWTPGKGASFASGDLNPQKARILLMLALSGTRDAGVVAGYFAGAR